MLTAIAVPVFTTQLERSRETIDLANIRSAYGEAVANALAASDGKGSVDPDTVSTTKLFPGEHGAKMVYDWGRNAKSVKGVS